MKFKNSDIQPVVIEDADISSSAAYYDYKTSLIKDIRVGLSVGIGLEYFISKDISLFGAIKYEEKGIHLKSKKNTPLSWIYPDFLRVE